MAALGFLENFTAGGGLAYNAYQSAQPQTLAYALQDSPAGWLAWVAQLFQRMRRPRLHHHQRRHLLAHRHHRLVGPPLLRRRPRTGRPDRADHRADRRGRLRRRLPDDPPLRRPRPRQHRPLAQLRPRQPLLPPRRPRPAPRPTSATSTAASADHGSQWCRHSRRLAGSGRPGDDVRDGQGGESHDPTHRVPAADGSLRSPGRSGRRHPGGRPGRRRDRGHGARQPAGARVRPRRPPLRGRGGARRRRSLLRRSGGPVVLRPLGRRHPHQAGPGRAGQGAHRPAVVRGRGRRVGGHRTDGHRLLRLEPLRHLRVGSRPGGPGTDTGSWRTWPGWSGPSSCRTHGRTSPTSATTRPRWTRTPTAPTPTPTG